MPQHLWFGGPITRACEVCQVLQIASDAGWSPPVSTICRGDREGDGRSSRGACRMPQPGRRACWRSHEPAPLPPACEPVQGQGRAATGQAADVPLQAATELSAAPEAETGALIHCPSNGAAPVGAAFLLSGRGAGGGHLATRRRLNAFSTFPRHYPGMDFDATITINDHHLATAGMTNRPAEAVAAVRRAVEHMPGAGWINVEAQYFSPNLPGWVILCPAGHGAAPDTPDWRVL
jgi:hypothetical protein